ncbi:helix-turn-helix domain-containing protein [Streptomyces albidoflavus]|uniref:helix-turn-helix domain-containing protein n=1 Tax=Streptomyces albidoflavus TaxID=1886 RepID=UPI0033BD8E25
MPETATLGERVGTLTRREREVLLLLPEGETNRMLGRRLGIADRTVKAHLTNIKRKLRVESRVQLALIAHAVAGGALPLGAMPEEPMATGNGSPQDGVARPEGPAAPASAYRGRRERRTADA